MFFKVGQKNKQNYTKKNQRMGLEYLRRSAIMGRLLLLDREALTKTLLTFAKGSPITKVPYDIYNI